MNALVSVATGFVIRSTGSAIPCSGGTATFLLNFAPILGPVAGLIIFPLAGLLAIEPIWQRCCRARSNRRQRLSKRTTRMITSTQAEASAKIVVRRPDVETTSAEKKNKDNQQTIRPIVPLPNKPRQPRGAFLYALLSSVPALIAPGGMPQAEVADLVQALGQDMLEEAAHELLAGDAARAEACTITWFAGYNLVTPNVSWDTQTS